MAELRRIERRARNFQDYKQNIVSIARQYYPELFNNLSDASIGSFLIDLYADIADSLSYHLDKTANDVNLETASSYKAIANIAKNNGIKIPGPKAAICEVELSCQIPLNNQGPVSDNNLADADEENYAPIIKKGTLFSNGSQTFELIEDVDFSKQFDYQGFSNRQIIPNRNANGIIVNYTYKKLALCQSGMSKVYRKIITEETLEPFLEITINDSNITSVESVIVRDGISLNKDPLPSDFLIDTVNKDRTIQRFHEVDSLIEQNYFGVDELYKENNPKYQELYDFIKVDNGKNRDFIQFVWKMVAKGKWKPIKHKFITEHIDSNNLKVTFGPGIEDNEDRMSDDATLFNQNLMQRMLANDCLGVLPKHNTTLFIQYRVGGGKATNIPKGAINKIVNLSAYIGGNCNDGNDANKKSFVLKSIKVTNTTPSYGGKDMMTAEELRHYIKYKSHENNRCVTLKDYVARVMTMPSKFGVPYRCNAVEENNKVILYTLGLKPNGMLMSELPNVVSGNIKEYLSNFKTINDLVEIRSGKVVNLRFEVNVIIGKIYDKMVVTEQIRQLIKEHFDISKHVMGEDIFIGELERKISNIEGVVNLISIDVFNPIGGAYTNNPIRQEIELFSLASRRDDEIEVGFDEYIQKRKVDLTKSDKILYCDADSMYEVRYDNDIVVKIKQR